jgi:hypothetical protein
MMNLRVDAVPPGAGAERCAGRAAKAPLPVHDHFERSRKAMQSVVKSIRSKTTGIVLVAAFKRGNDLGGQTAHREQMRALLAWRRCDGRGAVANPLPPGAFANRGGRLAAAECAEPNRM